MDHHKDSIILNIYIDIYYRDIQWLGDKYEVYHISFALQIVVVVKRLVFENLHKVSFEVIKRRSTVL